MIRWFDVQDNVFNLGYWLYEQGSLTTVEEVLGYFEKPWHWEDEWAEFQAELQGLKQSAPKLDRPPILELTEGE